MLNESVLRSLHPFWDRSIRFLFQRPDHLRAILTLFRPELAERLDFERLQAIPRSFILEDYREREADLVVRLPYRGADGEREVIVYLLLEHQSTVDRWMPFRMLVYLTCIWETQRRESLPSEPLTPIIPLVFYTGSMPWSASREFPDLVASPPELLHLVPRFAILFLSLSETPAPRLEAAGPIGWALRAIQRVEADKPEFADVLARAAKAIRPLLSDQWRELASFLALLVTYRRPQEEHAELQNVLQSATADEPRQRELGDMSQTYAEYLLEKGREEGLEKGRAEGLKLMLLEQGTVRFGPPSAKQRAALEAICDGARLHALGRFLLEAASWDELLSAG